jgi:hypothetical protein
VSCTLGNRALVDSKISLQDTKTHKKKIIEKKIIEKNKKENKKRVIK